MNVEHMKYPSRNTQVRSFNDSNRIKEIYLIIDQQYS